MEPDGLTILASLLALAAGIAVTYFFVKPKSLISLEEAELKAKKQLEEAKKEIKRIEEDTILRREQLKNRIHEDEKILTEQQKRTEETLRYKEEQFKNKENENQEIEKKINAINHELEAKTKQIEENKNLYFERVLQQSKTSIEEVKAQIFSDLERDLALAREDRLRKLEEYLNEEKVRIAKNIIVGAIQRYSSPTSVEKRNTAITVQRDDMKGKIIGNQASILNLIEELTGVDIIFNDSPNTIIVSCFDLVKKHIARETIAKILKEKVVTPEKVKQKLEETTQETSRSLVKIGRETIRELKLDNRNFPDDFARIIGRLQFRTSYGQNILKHSYEVGNFTLMLGGEIGANMSDSKIGGFFHDLGKAIDQEVGGSHDHLTKEIMEKYTFSEEEIHAAWAHHDAVPQRTAEAMLVKAGDAISAGRPGARQESIEKYIERIKAIEEISSSKNGVNKAFAISAGREVRVMVEPNVLHDCHLHPLAKEIASEIQNNVAYPGKIKVNVIRRIQSTDYAKK